MTDVRREDEDAIGAVLEKSYRAWAAGDADGMVADYTPDATAIMPGALRNGREAVRESMAHGFAGPLKGTSIESRQLDVRLIGSDVAIVLSESGILFPGQTEVAESSKVNATWVLEKRNGGWMIAAYHNSAVQA